MNKATLTMVSNPDLQKSSLVFESMIKASETIKLDLNSKKSYGQSLKMPLGQSLNSNIITSFSPNLSKF